MKVLYITVKTSLYGHNRSLLNLLCKCSSYGIEPLVIVTIDNGLLCDELIKHKIKFIKIKYYFSIYPSTYSTNDKILFLFKLTQILYNNFIALKKIINISKNFRPNIIHTNIGPCSLGYFLSKKLNIPHIWHLREYQDKDFDMNYIPTKKTFLRRANSSNTYPIAITNGIFNYFNLKSSAKVIYDGVKGNTEVFFESKKKKFFLFVGRLEHSKGLIELIDAFQEFNLFNNEYCLYIAGSGESSFEKLLYTKVKKMNLKGKIIFLGFRVDVDLYMQKATALIMPSKFEAFGRVTVEAIFNGCLVIGNNVAGTREILADEKLGILYDGHKNLVDEMKNVSQNINQYYPNILRAQKYVAVHYSNEAHANNIFEYYRYAISGFS